MISLILLFGFPCRHDLSDIDICQEISGGFDRSVQSDNGPTKMINFPQQLYLSQKGDHSPSISEHFPRNNFLSSKIC